MTPQKLGWFLVLFALAAYAGFYLAVSKAHASSEATPRDVQRLNACANASVRPDIKPENQEKEAVECAAWGKAVSHIESASGNSKYAITRKNLYGIRYWDKNGKPHIKTYKTYAESHADFARLYFKAYRGRGYKSFATLYTGEPHIIKAYVQHLSKYVPQYRKLYLSMTK